MHQKYAKGYGQFLELFKQLRVNISFIEVLQRMPRYAKYLKDLLPHKKLEEVSQISLRDQCLAVVLNKLPEKMDDPGLFTIPCLFGSDVSSLALADLGASINLMPYSLYMKLGLGELEPTRMSISMADKSVKYPRGIVENVLVKVGNFVFPVDFVVLDMEADYTVPIILGRPFLSTAKALIDVLDGKITLRVEDESITFDVTKKATKAPAVRYDSVSVIHSSLDHDLGPTPLDRPNEEVKVDETEGLKEKEPPVKKKRRLRKKLKPKCGYIRWLEHKLESLEIPCKSAPIVRGSFSEAKGDMGALGDPG